MDNENIMEVNLNNDEFGEVEYSADDIAPALPVPTEVALVASKYRLQAKRVEADWAREGHPGTLEVVMDGPRELIRGFDLCLVAIEGHPEVSCREKPKSRGLCASHVVQARAVIDKGLSSEEVLLRGHHILPKARRSNKTGAMSFGDYLITVNLEN